MYNKSLNNGIGVIVIIIPFMFHKFNDLIDLFDGLWSESNADLVIKHIKTLLPDYGNDIFCHGFPKFYINIFVDSLRNISSTMYEIFVNELNCAGMYSYRFLRSNDDTVPGNHITNAVHIFIGCSGIHRVMVVTFLMIYLEIVVWMDWCRHGNSPYAYLME